MAKRDSHGRMLMTVSKNTADIIDGIEDLTSWDSEELLRGQRRSKDGMFHGKPPVVVPQVIHAERTRRVMSKAFDLLRDSTLDAVRLLNEVINDPDAPLAERIKASALVMERTLPKSENLNVKLGIVEQPAFMKAIEGAIVTIDSGDDGDDDILDAELVEDDDDEDLIFD